MEAEAACPPISPSASASIPRPSGGRSRKDACRTARTASVSPRPLPWTAAYIWPEILSAPATQSASVTELLELQPSRAAVPHAVWSQLITGAREALDVLTYAGTFLFEQHNFVDILRDKVRRRCPLSIPHRRRDLT